MRTFLIFITLLLAVATVSGAAVFAQGLELNYPALPGSQLSTKPALPEFVRYIYIFSVISAGFLAVGSAVYGGFKYMASGGSPGARSEARAQITEGVLGSLILLGAYILLATINPQLAVFRIDKPIAQIPTRDTCDCFNPVTDQCKEQCEKEGLTASALEVPLGTLLEDALEPRRINALQEKGNKTVQLSKKVRDAALALQEETKKCSCSRAQPSGGCSGSQSCSPATQCTGQICDQGTIEKKKLELADAMEEFSDFMSKPDRSFTEFIRDGSRLLYANEFLQEIPDPVNYDNFLEIKQVLLNSGYKNVQINPFIAVGKTVEARGNDPFTFYVDEEQNKTIIEDAYRRIIGPPGEGFGGGGDGICSVIPPNYASGTSFNPEGAPLETIQDEVHGQLRSRLSEEEANIFFLDVIGPESGWNPGAQNFCSPHPPATGFYQFDLGGGVDADPDTPPGSYPNGYQVAEPLWSEQTLNPVLQFKGVRGLQDLHGNVCSGWEYWQVLDPQYGNRWTCNPCELGGGQTEHVPVCAGWIE
ncbi:MAG: hypothetical protein HY458_01895 [Parcubacteria group bacterium]|nr:hypothetical protein [Parcubacteria group bacterium]